MYGGPGSDKRIGNVRTEPSEKRPVFERLLGGNGNIFGEHAAQHKDVELSA